MTSIHFNSRARNAELLLNAADRSVSVSEARLASGLKVASARDNAAYWSLSRSMRSDIAAQSVLFEGLNQSLAVVDTAMSAAEPILRGIDRLKEIFTIGRQATPDEALTYDKEIRQIADMMETTVKSASFAGENLLYRSLFAPHTKTFLAGLQRGGDGALGMARMTLDLDQVVLIDEDKTLGLLSKTYYDRFNYTTGRRVFADYGGTAWLLAFYNSQNGALFNTGGRKANVDLIEQIGTAVREGFETLGAFQKRLETQRDFLQKLNATQTRGVGRLVDADLTQESARLKAEQTRRQLAVQSLSIANSMPALSLKPLLAKLR